MPFASAVLDAIYPPASRHESPKLPNSLHIPHFFSMSSYSDLHATLQRQNRFFLETGPMPMVEEHLSFMLEEAPDLSLSVSTSSAYRHDVALAVANHLNERFGLQPSRHMHITTCLQEAVVNAIIHGNLSIDSKPETPDDFDGYYESIDTLLANEALAEKRIIISAWSKEDCLQLAVTDQGAGFELVCSGTKIDTPHGRGLMLIKSLTNAMWLGKDMRSLYITFNY